MVLRQGIPFALIPRSNAFALYEKYISLTYTSYTCRAFEECFLKSFCVCMFCLKVCKYTMCIQCPLEVRRGHHITLKTEVIESCEPLCGCQKPNLVLCENKCSEPFLQDSSSKNKFGVISPVVLSRTKPERESTLNPLSSLKSIMRKTSEFKISTNII